MLAGGVVGFLEAATLTWLDSPGITVDGVTDLMTRMIWGGVSSLDDANGVHLPPRTTFDRSTFVPRGSVLADAPSA